MKKLIKKLKPLMGGAALLLLLLMLLLMSYVSGDSLPVYRGTIDAPGTQWLFGEKGAELQPVDVREKQCMQPGKTYVLSAKIVYDGSKDSYPAANFVIGDYGVKIYLEDELIFHRMREDVHLPVVNSLGTLAFSLPLGDDCMGKELRMELDPMMRFAARRILPDVQFGDYASMMREMYIEGVPNLISISAILFLSITLLAIGSVNSDMRRKCLNLALFAMAFSSFLLMGNLFAQHIFRSPYIMYLCKYGMLAIQPIFMIQAYQDRFSEPFRKVFGVLVSLCWINLAVQPVLHFTEIADIGIMVVFTHVLCFSAVMVILAGIIVERRRAIIRRVTIEIVPFLIGFFLDFFIFFYEINKSESWHIVGRFMSGGFFITLVLVIYEIRKTSEKAMEESLKSKFFQKMAYKDALTGINSRAAFDEEVQEISAGKRPYHKLLCVSADLNNLKKTNDTCGHQEGDDLIRRCAVLLEDCFKSCGRVFRVGGDEFNAFLYDVDEEDWPKLKQKVEEECEKRNRKAEIPLSVALGSANVLNRDVEAAIRCADERMYQDKEEKCKKQRKARKAQHPRTEASARCSDMAE